MTVEKPKPKQLLRPITTGTNSSMNQTQFLAINCNSPEAREKSSVHGAIGFGFASHWLKNWRESFKPITKRSNRNHVITFDSHLKTVLSLNIIYYKVYNEILIFFLNILAAVGDSEIRGKVKFMNFCHAWSWSCRPKLILLVVLPDRSRHMLFVFFVFLVFNSRHVQM